MGIKAKLGALVGAAVLAGSLMGFTPVPNTEVYHGQYLFAVDGSALHVQAAGHRYAVAEMPVTAVKNLGTGNFKYRFAIAVLNSKGKIVFFQLMGEGKAVNAFGGFTERASYRFKNLAALRAAVKHDIKHAHNGF